MRFARKLRKAIWSGGGGTDSMLFDYQNVLLLGETHKSECSLYGKENNEDLLPKCLDQAFRLPNQSRCLISAYFLPAKGDGDAPGSFNRPLRRPLAWGMGS